jgi:hypothetical protein
VLLSALLTACTGEAEPPSDPGAGSAVSGCTVEQPDLALPEPPVALAAGQACANDLVLFDDAAAWITLGLDPGSYSGGHVAMMPLGGGAINEWVDTHQGKRLARVGDYLYWAGRNKIGRVKRDGSSKLILVDDSSTPVDPRDLAADSTYVYFTTGSYVKAVPVGGGSVITLASGQASPSGLALDDTHVYWVNQGSSSTNGAIKRRPKTGGSVQTIVSAQARPDRIAVDGGQVFWLNLGTDAGGSTGWINGSVMRANKDGSSARSLAPATWPTDLAIDGDHVYFNEHAGTVKRVGKNGITSAVTLVSTNEPGFPAGIAVNDTHVYWTLGCGTASDGVRKIKKDAVAASNCVSTPEYMLHTNSPGTLSETGTWIYYSEQDDSGNGYLQRLWRNGGPPEPVASGPYDIDRVAADSRGVVWAVTNSLGPVLWAKRNETAPSVLTSSLTAQPIDLIIDSTYAYWLDTLGVHKVARDGSAAPVLLAAAQGQPQRMAQTPTYVFWTEDLNGQARVRRVTKTGSSTQLSFTTPGSGGDLKVDVNDIYVIVHGSTTSAIHAVARSGGTSQILAEGAFHPRDLYEDDDGLLFTSDSGSAVDTYRLLKTGELTPLAAELGTPGDVEGDSKCVAWATSEPDGHGGIWKVSRASFGLLGPGEQAVFAAQLDTVNGLAQGILPVTGTVQFTIVDGQITVQVGAVQMAVGVTHPQHLHRDSACPTMADDDNGDGFVDVVEALDVSGGVIVPLDPDLPYIGEQDNFPAPGADGTLAFQASSTVAAVETAINKDVALDTRTVMLHGVLPDFLFPSTVQGIDGVPPYRNIPLACGRLVRVNP